MNLRENAETEIRVDSEAKAAAEERYKKRYMPFKTAMIVGVPGIALIAGVIMVFLKGDHTQPEFDLMRAFFDFVGAFMTTLVLGFFAVLGIWAYIDHVRRTSVLGQKTFYATPKILGGGLETTVTYRQELKAELRGDFGTVGLIRREKAEYNKGSSTSTETHDEIVQEFPIPMRTWRAGDEITIQQVLRIPDNAMPNFKSKHNEIVWLAQVRILSENLSEIKEEEELLVEDRRMLA